MGIQHEKSVPYTPEQNGVAERENRTLMEAARCKLHGSKQPLFLWSEAVAYATYILNRVPTNESRTTPYRAWNGRKPDVSHIKKLGCKVFVHIPDGKRSKLDPKAVEGVLVDHCEHTKGYRIYIPEQRKVIISRDVIIDEAVPPRYDQATTVPRQNQAERSMETEQNTEKRPLVTPLRDLKEPGVEDQPVVAMEMGDHNHIENEQVGTAHDHQIVNIERLGAANVNEAEDIPENQLAQPGRGPLTATASTEDVVQENLVLMGRRQDGVRKSRRILLQQENAMVGMLEGETTSLLPDQDPYVPTSYKDEMECEDSERWKEAIKEEYSSILENKTWTVMPVPFDRATVKSRWIFIFKPGYKDVKPRYKARLLAKGYSQLYGVDYLYTYASVVKHYSIRLVLAIAAAKDLDIMQLDIKTAFLYGDLKEEIYLEQPEGLVIPGKEKEACRLHKGIYGLKQASRVWNLKFNDFLINFGLKRCISDPCVYYREQPGGEFTIVIIYVDDGLICSNVSSTITGILEYLSTHFCVRSLPANRFVGLDITRDRANRKMYINQPDFVKKILRPCNMSESNPISIPCDPNSRLTSTSSHNNNPNFVSEPYREAVGSLMYLMAMSRLDICLAVNQVAQFVQKPEALHWEAVKRIFAYLVKTPHHGLCYGKDGETQLNGYTDADFAGDLTTRKSTTGFVFMFNGGPVSWASRRQRSIALSTTDAEFFAVSEGAREAIWLKRLLQEIGIKVNKVPIRCDNKCAIQLVYNPENHQRTKHIDVKYFYVREQQEKGVLDISYIHTDEQIADIFTKPLLRPRFEKLRDLIGVAMPVEQ